MWRNENNNWDQLTNVSIPWEKTITVYNRNFVAGCGAGMNNNSNSTYTAKIFVNGIEKYTSNSTSVTISVAGAVQ